LLGHRPKEKETPLRGLPNKALPGSFDVP